ncbi:hypothetical protein NHP190012_11220 [Helicobacter sp. NHP19-012]|uniref:Mobilization protein n=1 Tax=Helicobacter gastrofelis TaxID=2849642 RepID=A0ABN6ICX0_9HELI|nr:plasmid recombination protein [Helicobacter sp. NHP19-012]BCZ19480.1 hypothetical protein NHP190012_11220 [Helicobacter sp. NHP19-012]
MAKASIHIEKRKNPNQERYNDRSIPPNYLLPEHLRKPIEVWNYADQALELKQAIVLKAQKDYSNTHNGRAFIATDFNYTGIVNLEAHHTLEEVKAYVAEFHRRYGWQCYQAVIHRDEGDPDPIEGGVTYNYHAHLEWITLDENNGESLKRKFYKNRGALRDLQTWTAEFFKMERGELVEISGHKHVDGRQYATIANAQKKRYRAKLEKEKQKAKKEAQEEAQKQYEKHLSPDQVKAQRLEDFKSLCSLAGMDSKDIPTKADEAKASLEAGIRQLTTNLSTLCALASGGKPNTPKVVMENFTNLETAINTAYSALIEVKGLNNELTTLDKKSHRNQSARGVKNH